MRLDRGTLKESKEGTKHTESFVEWYTRLSSLTLFIIEPVSVSDATAWKECYEEGMTPHEALRDEYPESEFPYYLEDSHGYK